MLDFQSGVDDHLTGITHIVRGIDLQDSAKRQRFVYDYFGWEYPEVVHWGKIQIDAYDVGTSTSTIKGLIEAGELDGWDDPRAPTLASVRRRGIRGEAVVDAIVELGTSTSDVDLAMSSIYSRNRDLIDGANRRFLVRDPEPLEVEEGPDAGTPPLHPDHEERGRREIPVGDAVVLEPGDVPAVGERVWLKGFGPVERTDEGLAYTDDDLSVVRGGDVDVIHWAPADGVPVRLRTMEGDVEGVAELGLRKQEVDDVVQFERVGFARIDDAPPNARSGSTGKDATDSRIVAYFAHP